MSTKHSMLRFVGTGLLYAGAAIGVSHLVQSTRAGALFGFQLMGIVFLTNFFKFPFFEAGSRYSGATGRSLIFAYGEIDRKILWFYIIQTVLTMFIIQAALTIVTTGLLKTLFHWDDGPNWLVSSLISLSCIILLFIGQYNALKNFTKWIVVTLTLCTLIAVFLASQHPVHSIQNTTVFSFKNVKDIAFLVALMGWMPAPIDISVWQSVWRVDGKEEVNVKHALIDFHVGYWTTALISLAFLSLGALIFFNSGETLATSASDFSAQLVDMYTKAIGKWSWPLVAFAAFATMFTTCLTCLDANPRVLVHSLDELKINANKLTYFVLVIFSAIGAVLIPILSGKNMTDLVDFATTVSFLTAPIFATLNFIIMFSNRMIPKEKQAGRFTKVVGALGLLLLYLFAGYYLISQFNGSI